MRIGIYDPYLDDLGGGEKYMMTIAEVLSMNHEVDVFWDNKEDLDGLLRRFSIDLSRVKIVPNIFSLKYSTFQRVIATKKYDRIIFLSDGSIPLVYPKLLVHIQQPLDRMEAKSIIGSLKIKRVNVFFCNSNYTKSFIDDKFHLKTKILFPPVKIKETNEKKENIILHVGRFRIKNVKNDDYKKQHVMVKQFKKMVDDGFKNWKFVLAVSVNEKDNKEFEEMKAFVKNYPIEFLVNRSNDDLWQIYGKAKIYWHASGYGEDLEKNPQFAEHFGISTVEAMGAGVVPVVINAGGQREIVTEGKDGLLWDTLDELEEKTLRLANDEKLRVLLSKEAKETAKRFSKEKFSEIVNGFIND